jgi:hypothetical protein
MGNVGHRSADLVSDRATKTATSDHSPLPLGSFLWKLRVLRQIIGDVEPRRFVRDEDMKLRLHARIIVEHAEGKTIGRRIPVKAAKKRGTAQTRKASVVAWRRLVVRDEFLSPSEICRANACSTSERCAMRLSTHFAVAVECAGQWTTDFVSNSAAKATTVQHSQAR